jgi:hypothetical protein
MTWCTAAAGKRGRTVPVADRAPADRDRLKATFDTVADRPESSHERVREHDIGEHAGQHRCDADDGVGQAVAA